MDSWLNPGEISSAFEMRDPTFVSRFGGVEGLMNRVHSTPNGLNKNRADFDERDNVYGKNVFLTPQPQSFLSVWFESFKDPTLIILMQLAALSLFVSIVFYRGKDSSWIDGVAILLTVVVVTLVGSVNTWSQEKQFQKLNERQVERNVVVIRSGETEEVSLFDIHVGDIVKLHSGDNIPADGVCIESYGIQCDESAMTGDSDLIAKDIESDPLLLCESRVQTGYGRMLVLSVGMKTQFGSMKGILLQRPTKKPIRSGEEEASSTDSHEEEGGSEETSLQKRLGNLAETIGHLGMISAGITLFLLVTCWLVIGFASKSGTASKFKDTSYWLTLLDYFIIAVTIVVVAVPEGLPLAVTISLAYSMRKMLRDKNLVRRLQSCETMACVNVICTDKTGTLTENKMKVTSLWIDDNLYSDDSFFFREQQSFSDQSEEIVVSQSLSSALTKMSNARRPTLPGTSSGVSLSNESFIDLMDECISLNTTADLFFRRKKHSSGQPETVNYLGNVTECALLMMLKDAGVDYAVTRSRKKNQIHTVVPFSSETKTMTTVLKKQKKASRRKHPGKSGHTPSKDRESTTYRTIIKGAPEFILQHCSHYLVQVNENETINDEEEEEESDEGVIIDPTAPRLHKRMLSPSKRSSIERLVENLSSSGLRLLAVAFEDAPTPRFLPGDTANNTLNIPHDVSTPLHPTFTLS